MEEAAKLLEMQDITVTFPGVKALSNVSFDLKYGEVHALVGENGAGKSTLIKVLIGVEKSETGEIRIQGKKTVIHNPLDASREKIAAVFQQLSQIPYLTVSENIFLSKSNSSFLLNRNKMNRFTAEILSKYNITQIKPTDVIAELSTAKRQLSEIVKAISIAPRILVLDEPTSALTEAEAEQLYNIIRELKSEGVGIIYISHRMNELELLADRVTVLRDGACIGTKDMKDITMQDIVNLMVGRNVDLYDKRESPAIDYASAEKMLEVKHVSGGMFKDISFDLYKGEILGIAGLLGSGRSELMDILFGITKVTAGEIWIDGKQAKINSVNDAMDHGIALIPESRHTQGLILIHSISDNISLPVIKRFQKGLFLKHAQKNKFAAEMIKKYNIKTNSPLKIVNFLSGGNQQKVVVSKWLSTDPKVLIIDEPTAGIDVTSKAEIHRLISDLTKAGVSVIMISSEMPELLAHSDRVMIMNYYRLVGILEKTDQQAIMQVIMKDTAKNAKAIVKGGINYVN